MNEPRIKKICNIYGYTGGNMDGTIYATDGLAPAMIVGGGVPWVMIYEHVHD
jgi:hypothetical protein